MELMRDAFVALVTMSSAAQNFRNDKNFFDSPKKNSLRLKYNISSHLNNKLSRSAFDEMSPWLEVFI